MVCGISLRGPCKHQDGLGNARSKMSMSPSLAPVRPLCKGPHSSLSTNHTNRPCATLTYSYWLDLERPSCLRSLLSPALSSGGEFSWNAGDAAFIWTSVDDSWDDRKPSGASSLGG